MKTTHQAHIKKISWLNIFFFGITTSVGVIGAPIYIINYGFSASIFWLFLFFTLMTGLGITVGYHRYFAHSTFKATKLMEFLILFFGAASFEQSALQWASQHRDHHRYVDTDKDPYSIKKGFFHAHIGWLIFWEQYTNYDNAQDIQKSRLAMHQHKYFLLWSITAGIVFPVILGALTGHALAAFIFAVCLRLTFVYHSTFFINSLCHMFGKTTYDLHSTAKDNGLIAFLTNGEGYHNFHHRFPNDYRNAIRWYQWDPSKWLIWSLSKLGLVHSLKRVSQFRILEAKIKSENQRAKQMLENQPVQEKEVLKAQLDEKYLSIQERLAQWEKIAKEYQTLLTIKQTNLKKSMALQLQEAKITFFLARKQWRAFHSQNLKLT